ncbi:hypothetical protein pb186bvf_011987 [Paramecium bursaria]
MDFSISDLLLLIIQKYLDADILKMLKNQKQNTDKKSEMSDDIIQLLDFYQQQCGHVGVPVTLNLFHLKLSRNQLQLQFLSFHYLKINFLDLLYKSRNQNFKIITLYLNPNDQIQSLYSQNHAYIDISLFISLYNQIKRQNQLFQEFEIEEYINKVQIFEFSFAVSLSQQQIF